MAIESVGTGTSAMSYQSTTADIAVKPIQQAKDAQVEQTSVATTVASDTVELKVQSGGEFNQGSEFEQQSEDQKRETIKKSVAELNKNINKHTEAKFGIHEDTKRITIKIVDKDTQELIREVPPEKTLDMIAKVWEIAGILVDERR